MATWPQHGQERAWPYLLARKIPISGASSSERGDPGHLRGRLRGERGGGGTDIGPPGLLPKASWTARSTLVLPQNSTRSTNVCTPLQGRDLTLWLRAGYTSTDEGLEGHCIRWARRSDGDRCGGTSPCIDLCDHRQFAKCERGFKWSSDRATRAPPGDDLAGWRYAPRQSRAHLLESG
jgi:hypothetical protein